MTDPKRFPVRYVGTDPGTEWLPGVPAQDLSEADLRSLELGALPLVESGLYEAIPAKVARKAHPAPAKNARTSSTVRASGRAKPPSPPPSPPAATPEPSSPPSAPVVPPSTPTPPVDDHPSTREFMETPDRNGGEE